MPLFRLLFLTVTLLPLAVSSHTAIGKSRSGIVFLNHIRDLGEVVQGEKSVVTFPFENRGDRPITVQGVHSPCGCTVAEAEPNQVYEPGAKGVIQVTFNSSDFVGRVVKAVTVMTDQKYVPTKTLTIKAKVIAELDVQPPVIDFGEVRGGSESVKEIVVRRVRGSQTKILEVIQDHDWIDVLQVSGREDEWRYQVRLKPPMSAHFLKDDLVLKTDSKVLPEIKVLLRASITGAVTASPQYIEFGAVPPEQMSEKVIELDGVREFEVDKVLVELSVNGSPMRDANDLIEVKKDNLSEAKHRVSLRLRNDSKIGGSVHGKISVLTSDPEQKKLSVDFYAFFL